MTEIAWDQAGDKEYETGVDHGVLYIPDEGGVYDTGVAWNGLVTVTESPSGAEENAQYADNIKYIALRSAEEFGGTIEALTYPDEFQQFDGSVVPVPGVVIGQQNRRSFGMSYRTVKGNDLLGNDFGYKLHLVYGCSVNPSEKAYTTINDSPEGITFSWEFSTTPVPVPGYKPAATLTIDSTEVDAGQLAALEELLYGTVSEDPSLPTPTEVLAIFTGTPLATGVTVTGDTDSIDITGTTTNYLFTVEHWDGDEYVAVEDGVLVNEAAAEALVLANGTKRVTVHAAEDYYVPAAQQDTFIVTVL